MNEATLTPELTAQIINKSVMFVRCGLRANRLPFGTGVQMEGGRWSYNISRKLLEEYIGKERVEEVMKGANKNERDVTK